MAGIDLPFEIKHRVARRIVAKSKGAPLGRHEPVGLEIAKSSQGLICVHVRVMHEPARLIGGSWQQSVIDRSEFTAELPISDKIATIPPII